MKDYSKLLYKAREVYNGCVTDAEKRILETIFPELKESEYEQHRKWILEYLYDGLRKSDEQFKNQFKHAISWLEKQGERKSVWSEDDERRFDNLIRLVENSSEGEATKQGFIEFINRIKSSEQQCLKQNEEKVQGTKRTKRKTENKCPNYQGRWGCAISPMKQCNVCPDYKMYK